MLPLSPASANGIRSASRRPAASNVYYFELLGDASNRTQTLLRNKAGDRGIGQRFSTDQLPCYTLWKDTRLSPDGYVTGLEPGTNLPSPRSFELDRGRVRKMKPGETKRFDYALNVPATATRWRKPNPEIARLQAIAIQKSAKRHKPTSARLKSRSGVPPL